MVDVIGIGKQSYTHIAKQTTIGTAATTGFINFPTTLDETVEGMRGKIPDESAVGTNNPNPTRSGNIAVAGNIKGYPLETQWAHMLNFVYGALDKTTPTGASDAIQTHPTPVSYTHLTLPTIYSV